MTDTPKRIQIIIVDRVQQWRFPRSKKRRIRAKWRKREENYRPHMVPIGFSLHIGAEALLRLNEEGRRRSDQEMAAISDAKEMRAAYENTFEMSTDLWCMAAGLYPEFAERCDLFYKADVEIDGIIWTDFELVPIPWRDWAAP